MYLSIKQLITKIAQTSLVLAILVSFVAHLPNPQIVKADETDEAQVSQKGEVISQGPEFPAVKLAIARGLVKTNFPDRVVEAVITAYTSTPDQTDDSPFIAASGKRVHDGMIAANWLPFGTKVRIPSLYGNKIFVVEDRMNSRYGFGRMDIWFDSSKSEARKFGVKRVDVEVFYPVKAEIAKK